MPGTGPPLSDALGVPLVPDLLLRQHPTRHQVGLSEAERVANLKSAFLSLPEVRGKRILLVDDTYTTGTTLRRAALACSIHMPGPPPWTWPSSPERRAKSTISSTTGAPHTSHSPKTAENSDCGGLSCSDVS